MKESDLIQKIGDKENNKELIAIEVAQDPGLISQVIEGLNAGKAATKYGCAKVLRIISVKRPDVLYPHIELFTEFLDSNNNVIKWEGIHLIGNLAVVDTEKKIDEILDKYLEPISGPVMITAANTIRGSAKIACAKTYLADKITTGILKVEHAEYKTYECRNIALGHAIDSFDMIFDRIECNKPVLEMIRKQLNNDRNSTRKKAEKFLKKRLES